MIYTQPTRFFLLLLIQLFFIASSFAYAQPPLEVVTLRVEYKENPQGIDVTQPRFSWKLKGEGRNRQQSAYRILVASSPEKLRSEKADIWDTQKVETQQTNQVVYAGPPLESMSSYYWKLKVWDENGQPSAWSDIGTWSMGILGFSEWEGLFIGLNVGHRTADKYQELYLPPARYLRKQFSVDKKIKRATAYTTALGLYELRLNGAKVGNDYFLPGWTDYDQRVYYQTFDITDHLTEGENVIGAIIADGWYSGYIGYALLVGLDQVRGFYGENPSFMGQIMIEYEDGSRETISTDQTWKANTGAIQEADMLMGEHHDARLQPKGWDTPNFDDSSWQSPKVYTYPDGRLQAYPGTQVTERERLKPVEITEPKPDVYVFDLGKNIAGIAELQVQGPEGTAIKLEYGEILKEDGTILKANLRKARATDTYILAGDGEEIWQPKFTYHGFQFVQVTGLPSEPDEETITAIVLSSIDVDGSTFEVSNAMNNQLYENIKTTQSANFFEVPTDCPQRDERLGWTGDAQIFCRSSTYNANVAPFFTKFLIDLDDAQRWYGAYPNFAPFPYSRPNQYSPAWMDAGVIIPYNMYKVYGDTRILDQMYPGMEKFMEFQEDASTDYLRPGAGNNWGDWLAVDEETSYDFIATAYYGYDAALMSEIAEALGKGEDHQRYQRLFKNIKNAFAQEYIKDDGYTTEDTQTSYALALHFDLYPEELAEKAAARLAEKISSNNNKFSSGFLGTKHVMLVLSQYGHDDLAFKLFKQTEYPSWGYSVVNGSTSIWERWNSYTKDAGKNAEINAAMNSFSHYAFGSVAEWMFMYGLGIDTEHSAYRNILIKPSYSREVDFMKGSYESINGTIASGWEWQRNQLLLTVDIPVNTTAKIHLPTDDLSKITESDNKLDNAPGVKSLTLNQSDTVVEVGSGHYVFSVDMK